MFNSSVVGRQILSAVLCTHCLLSLCCRCWTHTSSIPFSEIVSTGKWTIMLEWNSTLDLRCRSKLLTKIFLIKILKLKVCITSITFCFNSFTPYLGWRICAKSLIDPPSRRFRPAERAPSQRAGWIKVVQWAFPAPWETTQWSTSKEIVCRLGSTCRILVRGTYAHYIHLWTVNRHKTKKIQSSSSPYPPSPSLFPSSENSS